MGIDLDMFAPQQLQFLERETRDFKCMDKEYVRSQMERAKNGFPLQVYRNYYQDMGYNPAQVTAIMAAFKVGIPISTVIAPTHSPSEIKALTQLALVRGPVKEWLNESAKKIKLFIQLIETHREFINTPALQLDERQLAVVVDSLNLGSCIGLVKDLKPPQLRAYLRGMRHGVIPIDKQDLLVDIPVSMINDLVETELCERRRRDSHNYCADDAGDVAAADSQSINLRPYIDAGFNPRQLKVISIGLNAKIDISQFAKIGCDATSMALLCKDLMQGRDITLYNMDNITYGLRVDARAACIAGKCDSPILRGLHPNMSRDDLVLKVKQYYEQELAHNARKNPSGSTIDATKSTNTHTDNDLQGERSVSAEIQKISNFGAGSFAAEASRLPANSNIEETSARLAKCDQMRMDAILSRVSDLLESEAKLHEYLSANPDIGINYERENPYLIRIELEKALLLRPCEYPATEHELTSLITANVKHLLLCALPYTTIFKIVTKMTKREDYRPLLPWFVE